MYLARQTLNPVVVIYVAMVVAFNVAWYVMLAHPHMAVASLLALLGLHLTILWLSYGSVKCLGRQLLWGAAVALLGGLIETVFFMVGVWHSLSGEPVSMAPFWLVCIWWGFSCLFGNVFAFLASKPAYYACICGAGFCLSYWLGANLSSSVSLASPIVVSLGIIAAVWSVLLPILVRVHTKYVAQA